MHAAAAERRQAAAEQEGAHGAQAKALLPALQLLLLLLFLLVAHGARPVKCCPHVLQPFAQHKRLSITQALKSCKFWRGKRFWNQGSTCCAHAASLRATCSTTGRVQHVCPQHSQAEVCIAAEMQAAGPDAFTRTCARPLLPDKTGQLSCSSKDGRAYSTQAVGSCVAADVVRPLGCGTALQAHDVLPAATQEVAHLCFDVVPLGLRQLAWQHMMIFLPHLWDSTRLSRSNAG